MTNCVAQDVVVTAAGGDLTLVEGVDLSVAAGEMLGVVGETGAGKTVTMRAILGLLPPGLAGGGTLTIGDRVLDLGAVGALRGLLGVETGVVLQNPMGMLDPLMRIGDQLVEGVVRKRLMSPPEARGRAISLTRQMGFTDPEELMRLYPHQLSGGMAQRVTTAMGIMPRPRLLVVDEPTSALDATIRLEVMRLLRRLAREEGSAVVLVSHDLGLVSHFCETLTVLYSGRAVESGPTAGIVAAPAHPYTAALLDASSTLTAERRRPLRAIAGTPPSRAERIAGCAFAPRCPRSSNCCVTDRPALRGRGERDFACHHPEGLAS